MNNFGRQLKKLQNNEKGFTLIELLIVIVIIAALAVTVFTALNPVKRIKDAHDSRRFSDVDTVLSAIHSYIVDNNGSLPLAIAALPVNTMTVIGGAGAACIGAANCNTALAGAGASYSPIAPAAFACGGAANNAVVNSATLTTNLASYLKALPADPLGTFNTLTGYAITVGTGNIITVTACYPEDNGNGISESR